MEEIKKEEDISLNIDKEKLIHFIKKYHLLLLILIPIFLSIFYRAYPYDLPITKDFAENTVQQNLKSQIQTQILQQAPDIDQESLNALANQRLNEYLRENPAQYKEGVKQARQSIKNNYQDDAGNTYLLAIDPYHYLRQAQNILENGHVGDEIRDGKSLDNHMLAPNGRTVYPSLHPYAIAIAHRISSIFGNDSVKDSAFILPLIFITLSIIPCFFIVKRFAGKVGALLASSILAVHPIVLSRTPAGFSDTDSYNIFFPLTITWLMFESFRTKKVKNRFLFAGLAGLATGVFAFAWSAWWFFFYVVLATIGIYIIYLIIIHKKEFYKKKLFKNVLKSAIAYILSSIIFVSLFTGTNTIIRSITAAITTTFLKQAAYPTLWPNVYTTVAELNEVSFSSIISNMGGNLLVILAFLGPLLILFTKKHFSARVKYSLLVIIWLIVTLYASTKGLRFILLTIPAYSIGLGITAGVLYNKVLKFSVRSLKLNKILIAIILIAILIFSFYPMLAKADRQAKNEVPSFDDTWYLGLTKIKEDSQENAIITSWWDYGHWFKAIADRPVTFDGASQNSPKAHWVGKLFLTSDEEEAIGILRMLDCGSESAYNLLLEDVEDRILTKNIIDEIILQSKEEARNTLSKHTDDPEKILEKTHCDPPEAFVITSEDMVSKAGVWAHFGSWSFERARAYNIIKANSRQKATELLVSELDYSEEEAEDTYSQLKGIPESDGNAWISPYPGYMDTVSCSKQTKNKEENATNQTETNETEEVILCANGIIIENNRAYIPTEEGEKDLAYFRTDTEISIKEEGISDFAAAYLPEKNQVVIMSPMLLESIFTELFFYQGKNLKHFELFGHQRGLGQFNVYTWKVKWNSQ